MKSYEELEANAYQKAEIIISRQKRRKMILLRSGAIGLGAAAVLGIGIFTNVMKPPRRPTPDQPGIITESSGTVTTSAVTTAKTTAERTTASVAASKADITTSGTEANTVSVVTSAPKAAETARTTEVRTTAITTVRTTVRTAKTSATTAAPQTTAAATVGSSAATVTTQSVPQTANTSAQTQTSAMATTIPDQPHTTQTTDPEDRKILAVSYGNNSYPYYSAWIDSEKVTVDENELGECLGVESLRVTYDMSEYYEKPCKVYTIKRFSPDFAIAVQCENDDAPKLYFNRYNEFKTLGELIEATDMENILVLKEAYWGFKNPAGTPLGTPDISDLMNALSDTNARSYHRSVMGNAVSYTIWAELPMFGNVGWINILTAQPKASYGYISLDIFGNNCTYRVDNDKLREFIISFGGSVDDR